MDPIGGPLVDRTRACGGPGASGPRGAGRRGIAPCAGQGSGDVRSHDDERDGVADRRFPALGPESPGTRLGGVPRTGTGHPSALMHHETHVSPQCVTLCLLIVTFGDGMTG